MTLTHSINIRASQDKFFVTFAGIGQRMTKDAAVSTFVGLVKEIKKNG